MFKVKKPITNIRDISRLLYSATVDETMVEATILTWDRRLSSYFICNKGNLARRSGLYISSPLASEEEKRLTPGMPVSLSFNAEGQRIEVNVITQGFRVLEGLPALELSFPEKAMASSERSNLRIRVPEETDLKVSIKRRQKPSIPTADILDISLGGSSCLYRPQAAGPISPGTTLLKVEDQVTMELQVTTERERLEIPLFGVVRRVSRIRTANNELKESCGIEFMMISTTHKARFVELVESLNKYVEESQQSKIEEGEKSHLADCDYRFHRHRQVFEAIESGQVEKLLEYLTEFYNEEDVSQELVRGIIEKGFSNQIYQAFELLQGANDAHPGLEPLFNALLEKKRLENLVQLFQLLPEGSPLLESLTRSVVTNFRGNALVKAVEGAVKKPVLQLRIIRDGIANSGSSADLLDCLLYVEENPPAALATSQGLMRKEPTVEEMVAAITRLRNIRAQGEELQPLLHDARRCVVLGLTRKAGGDVLVNLLARTFSDHTPEAELVVTELVRRGEATTMVDAFKHMTMDSTSSMILAYGLSRTGNRTQVQTAMRNTSTCKKAMFIMGSEMLLAKLDSTLRTLTNAKADQVLGQISGLKEQARKDYERNLAILTSANPC